MQFSVHGPFPAKKKGSRVLKAKDKKAFWVDVESICPGLSSACGCYIFCIGPKAWYVGLAEKQSFQKECFSPTKLLHYTVAQELVQGRPTLLFIAKRTAKKNAFAKPSISGHKDVQFLENILIGAALARNPDLLNAKGTKFLKRMVVPGILNTPKGVAKSTSVQSLKKALGTR